MAVLKQLQEELDLFSRSCAIEREKDYILVDKHHALEIIYYFLLSLEKSFTLDKFLGKAARMGDKMLWSVTVSRHL